MFRTLSPLPRSVAFVSAALVGSALAGSAALAQEEPRRAMKMDDTDTAATQSAELRAQADLSRKAAIDKLSSLLETATGDRKAEMLLRLAELYWEQGKSDKGVEMAAFSQAFDDCFNDPKRQDRCESEVLESQFTTKSTDAFTKAVRLYQAVETGYPRYLKADQAIFYLGIALNDLKRFDEGAASFKKLVKMYPQSLYLTDAYIQIGEYHFDKNEASSALQAYKLAAQNTAHSRYGYALYKLAWCYYNVDEARNAIDTMKRVIAYSLEKAAANDAKAVKFTDEALKDIVLFFADADAYDEAEEFFAKLGRRDLFRKMLTALASKTFDQGKYNDSVSIYRRLIQDDPNNAANPGFQGSIIECFKKLRDQAGILRELETLQTQYGRTSAWAKANAANKNAIEDAQSAIERGMREVATAFNLEAVALIKAKHPSAKQAYERANDAYELYLANFGTEARAYSMHFDFGEFLYDQQRYERAYEAYLAAFKLDPKGQNSEPAVENAIFAAKELVTRSGIALDDLKPVPKELDVKTLSPKPISEWEQKFIDACKTYADNFKTGEKNIEIFSFQSANLLYNRYHFDDASKQFQSVIAKWPKSPRSMASVELILDVLDRRGDYTVYSASALGFAQNTSLGDAKFHEYLWDRYLYGVEKLGDWATYGATAKTLTDDTAQTLVYRIKSAERYLGALEEQKQLVTLRDQAKAWSTGTFGDEAFRTKMAGVYRNISLTIIDNAFKAGGDKTAYADNLIAFTSEFSTDADRAKLLKEAVEAYTAAKQVKKMIATREQLVADFGKNDPDYLDQIAALGDAYYGLADFTKSADYYLKFTDEYPNAIKAVEAKIAIEKDEAVKAKLTEQRDRYKKTAPEALYTSAQIQRAVGDWQAAVERFTRFTKEYATDPRTPNLRLVIAQTYEEQKVYDRAIEAYKAIFADAAVATDVKFFARLHTIRAMDASGRATEALDLRNATVAVYKKLGAADKANSEVADAIGEILFSLADAGFQTYLKQPIKPIFGKSSAAPSDTQANRKKEDESFKTSLQAKIKARVDLETKYTEIVETKSGVWGLASLVRFGQTLENLAESLRTAECPFYLNEDDCQLYGMQVADASYPLVDQAAQVYEKALETAFNLNIYNDNTALATRRLGDLKPELSRGLRERLPAAGVVSDKVGGALDFATSMK